MEVLGTCDEVLKLVSAAICKPSDAPATLTLPQSEAQDIASELPAAKKSGNAEPSSVLPGAHVLTIATAE